jgi:putative peptidoglycan lipid II flippase
MNKKYLTTIAGASIIISFLSVFSKGLGFLREMLFAGIFGLGSEYDLYLVSSIVPLTISTILLYIGQNYFIPNFDKFNKTDMSKGILFLNFNLILFFIFGCLISFVLYLFSGRIIDNYLPGMSLQIKLQAKIIFIIYLVSIPISSLISILSAYFQQKYEFIIPAVSQLFLNLSILILVPIYHIRYGIVIIPIGYLVGTIIQLFFLLKKAKIISIKIQDFLYFRKFLFSISSSIILIIMIESISQLYTIADRYYLFKVDQGGISALNYAMNILLLPITIIAFSVYTVIFPKITNLFNNRADNELKIFLQRIIKFFLVLFIPLTFVFIFNNNIIIKLLYERGKFGQPESIMTGTVLSYLSLSLFVYAVYGIFNKIFYSAGMIKILLLITIMSCLIKLGLNILIVGYMKQNGLALSTSITYLFLFTASIHIMQWKLKVIDSKMVYSTIGFLVLNGTLSYLLEEIIFQNYHTSFKMQEVMEIFLFIYLFYQNLIILNYSPMEYFKNLIMNKFNLVGKEY